MPSTITRSPALESLRHDVIILSLVAELDGSHLHLVFAVNDHDCFGALQLLDSALRHQNRVFSFGNRNAYAGKLSGSQIATRIWEARLDLHCSSRGIYSSIEDFETARFRMFAVVGKDQFELDTCSAFSHVVAVGNLEVLISAEIEIDGSNRQGKLLRGNVASPRPTRVSRQLAGNRWSR